MRVLPELFKPVGTLWGGILAICLLVVALRLARTPVTAWGIGLMFGGWLSNLLTLEHAGHYVDYLKVGSLYTNIADLGITLGAAILIMQILQAQQIRLKKP